MTTHLNWLWWFIPRQIPSAGGSATSHRPWGAISPSADISTTGSITGQASASSAQDHWAKSKPIIGSPDRLLYSLSRLRVQERQ